MNNCFIYIRVSTDDQAETGFSLDNQKRVCTDYAKDHNLHVKRVFEDEGRSGRTTDRPAFQEMLQLAHEQEIDALIIYKIDRFARNVADFSTVKKNLESLGIKLISVMEGDISNGSSLVANIFASVAQWESEVNGQRTKDALEQKFREGWQPSPPPLGYRSVGGEKEKKTCEPDPYVAPIIRELFHLYATGNYSLLELQDWLASKNIISRNGTDVGDSVINTILKNPFYYGLIRWKGQSKMGNHEPLINRVLFDSCQYILAKHRSFLIRKRIHNFLLRGFIYCGECGQRYTAEWHYDAHKLKSRGGRIAYYHCQKRNRNGCPSPYIQADELETQVEKEVKKLQFSEEFIAAVIAKTKEIIENNRRNLVSDRTALLNQKTALEMKRSRLEDSLLEGTVDRDTFKRKHTEIQDKITNLEIQLKELEDSNLLDTDLIEEVLAFSRDIYRTYKEAPAFLKRHYLRFFFERIYIKNRRISESTPTPIFASLLENQQVIISNNWLRGVDSNH